MPNNKPTQDDKELINYTYLPSVFRNECTKVSEDTVNGTITYDKKELSDFIKWKTSRIAHLKKELEALK